MRLNNYAGAQGLLRLERKVGWQRKTLTSAMLFFHGGPMSPSQVRQDGLDAVRFGQEYCTFQETGLAIAGGKLIFSFLVVGEVSAWDKPGAARRLWGGDGHGYIFQAPVGTEFYSSGAGQPVANQETAFPYLIESADMRYYCTPDTRGMHGGAARSFMAVNWTAVVAAQI